MKRVATIIISTITDKYSYTDRKEVWFMKTNILPVM